MKKKIFTPEILLLLVSFTITGLAILFIAKPSKMNYLKLIKWSNEDKIVNIYANTARRMYPILSENHELHIKLPLDFNQIDSKTISSIIKKITLLQIQPNSKTKDTIILNLDKRGTIVLETQIYKVGLKNIKFNNYFDGYNLEKLVKKNLENDIEKNYIFSAYQSKKDTYTIFIFDLTE